jgi:4-amino-4-deoxy-L-arabinose transferase-like glycosyltransferase
MTASVQESAPAGSFRGACRRHAALGLFVLALALRLLVAVVAQFDGLYGQDGFAYFECAQQILSARHLLNPCDDFAWPLGYPALAALFMLVAHGATFGAQLAAMLAGAAIAPLCYWAVIAIGGAVAQDQPLRYSAVAAGLIAAFCGQLILSSLVIMSDAPGLFWATLSACLLLQWQGTANGDRGYRLMLPAAGAALGLAAVTRWIFGGLALPFGVFTLIVARRKLSSARSRAESSRYCRVEYLALLQGGVLLTGILCLQLLFNTRSAALVLDHSWVVNWSLPSAWHSSFDNPDGHFDFRLPPFIFNAAPVIYPLYLCPLLTPFTALGAWQLRRSATLVLLGGWMAVLYLYLIGIPFENARFPLAFFPPIAVLTGIGLWQAWPLPRVGPAARWALLAVSLLVTVLFAHRTFLHFDAANQRQFAAIRYVRSHVPPTASVVTFGLSISLAHYSNYTVIDLFMQSPQSLRAQICGERTAYLIVDEENLDTQWMGHSPATNFYWLKESMGLTAVGSEGAWTLYRIRPCSR